MQPSVSGSRESSIKKDVEMKDEEEFVIDSYQGTTETS